MDLDEYSSRDVAVNFSKLKKSLPEKAFEKILEELRAKQNESESINMGKNTYEFNSMVDVGCGTGSPTKLFAPFFKSIIGIDASGFQIERAKETNTFKNINYKVGTGEEIPLPNKCVDLALFVFSAFFMDFEKIEIELDRVLKSNGLGVLYGDIVDGIDLLNEASSIVCFPESETKSMKLWNDCFKLFVEHASQTNHPQRHVFDGYKTMFQSFQHLRKRKIDDIKSFVFLNLQEFISIWNESIPFFANFSRSLEKNPVKEFEENLKRLWKVSHVDSKDINVRITYSSFMILPDKNI